MRVPKLRLHYKGQFTVRLNGKDIYLGKDKKQAESEYALIISDYLKNARKIPVQYQTQQIDIEELTLRFLTWAKEYYRKPNGQCTGVFPRLKIVAKLLIGSFGQMPVEQFSPLHLKSVRQIMVDQGLSRKIINQRTGILCQIFKWGASEEICDPDIFHALKMVSPLKKGRTPAPDHPPVKPVPMEIVEMTCECLPKLLSDAVHVLLYTGARPAEILQIRPCDIDRTVVPWRYVPEDHKTAYRNKDRIILIGARARTILEPYIRELGEESDEYIFSPQRSEALRGRKSKSCNAFYNKDSFRQAIIRACDKAKVPRWFPYMLRHSFATAMREASGLEATSIALGHSNMKTSEIYAESRLDRITHFIEMIG